MEYKAIVLQEIEMKTHRHTVQKQKCELKKETEKAILLHLLSIEVFDKESFASILPIANDKEIKVEKEVWFPKSQIQMTTHEEKQVVLIPAWLLEKQEVTHFGDTTLAKEIVEKEKNK